MEGWEGGRVKGRKEKGEGGSRREDWVEGRGKEGGRGEERKREGGRREGRGR